MARCTYDWVAATLYCAQGHTLTECSKKFGFTLDAWYKAIGRGLIPRPPRQNLGARLRYDWDAIQRYYDEGHTYLECKVHFGFAATSWQIAVTRGRIKTRPQRSTVEKLLRDGKRVSHMKRRLIEAGVRKDECSRCGLSEWLGQKLVIQIDHINGNCTDNRLENFRMLCPNCHSQTETFGGRNKARVRENVESRASNAALR